MEPYYQDNHIKIYNKDCRLMDELPDGSVQCVVTSPPFWGLRKYSGLPDLIWGGKEDCVHQFNESEQIVYGGAKTRWQHQENNPDAYAEWDAMKKSGRMLTGFCSLCGAWKGAYGLEPTPEMYIEHTIEILREIRRVLRKDGVVFWNIGDSYSATRWSNTPSTSFNPPAADIVLQKQTNLPPKNLCLIPFRVAIAAQEDGWWVRSIIIWSKSNPMPESVTDRPTESHEYILMLTKSARYYWDADAVREPISESYADDKRPHGVLRQRFYPNSKYVKAGMMEAGEGLFPTGERVTGRNIRSVWEFPTQPYPEAHFAVFPEKLPEICIKAATPEVGCCSKCGAPWERVTRPVESEVRRARGTNPSHYRSLGQPQQGEIISKAPITLGWQPACNCNADKVPSLVLDPFVGSGTTLWVAKKVGRYAVGYELSGEYCELAIDRCRQMAMEFI